MPPHRTPTFLRGFRGPLRMAVVGAGAALALLAPALASTAEAAPVTRLTTEAARAGLEPGNATMGWRERSVAQQTQRIAASRVASAAVRYKATGVLGIDVSSYQSGISWSHWRSKGKTFAYIKATEGTSYRNPYFTAQFKGAAKAGMLRGAYHFASPNGKAGYQQARYFVAHGGAWTAAGAQTLPGVLDIEYNPYGSTCYGLSKAKMVKWIASFTSEYKKLTTKDAVIYTTTDWWTRCTGNTTKFTKTNPLWAARYGTTSAGTLPGAWTTSTFWQYTSSPLDQDRFSASAARLKVLATVTAVPKPVTPPTVKP